MTSSASLSRRGLLGGLAAGGLAALAGCGGASSGGSPGSGGRVTTVVVWDKSGALADARKKFFEEWNAGEGADAGVAISYEPQASDKYEEVVRLAFQTKRAPDIFHSPSAQLGAYIQAGWAQPLDGLIEQGLIDSHKKYLDRHSQLAYDGKAYALPTVAFTNRLAINTELFEQAGLDPASPPKTFDEVRKAAAAIAKIKKGETFGIALPIKAAGFRGWYVEVPVMASNPDLTPNGLFNMSSQHYQTADYQACLEMYRATVADKTAFPGSATLKADAAQNAFGKGEVGMIVSSSGLPADLAALKSTVKAKACPLPVQDGKQLVQSPTNAGFPYAISALTKNPEAVAKAFGALVGAGMQQALAEHSSPAIDAEVWDTPAMKKDEFLQGYRPGELDKQWPKSPSGVIHVQGAGVTDTLAKLVLKPDVAMKPELASLQKRLQKAFDDAVKQKIIDPKDYAA